MIKVVAISDTHMMHLELEMPSGDILLHCGDGTDMGEEKEIIRLNAWFKKLKAEGTYDEIVYVPGNHDILFEEDEAFARELMPDATILIDQAYHYKGINIYGTPWSVTFFDWAFMKPDLNLAKEWDKIPNNTDILMVHSPPYGILDKTFRGQLAGSQTLTKAVFDKQPRYCLFGHIHEDGGKQYIIEPTTFMNVASCPGGYDPRRIPEPTVFSIDPRKESNV